MKLKYFMRGLGTGIILTTIVLFSFRHSSKQELSNEQIIKKATALGMEMKTKGIDLDSLNSDESNSTTNSNVDNKKQTQTSSEGPKSDSTQKSEDVNTDDSKETKSSTVDIKNTKKSSSDTKEENLDSNEQKKSDKKDTSTENNKQYITAMILSGMRATQVSEYLKSIGVIENEDEFVDYIKEQKSQSKICADTYEIPEGATYSEILSIITKNK